MSRYFVLALAIMLIGMCTGCTNLLVTPGASAEGTAHISYMADTGALFGTLGHLPPTNESMRTTYDWDSGLYLGEIPGATHPTYNVIGNTNEHGLTIGETTFGGNATLAGGPGVLDYGSVIWITLQRARNASEAITVMDGLMQKYGYTSEGESFSVADPQEVWIMEVIGKGPKTKGTVWVAKRIPDGAIAAHANQARIRAPLTLDAATCRYSSDVVSFAQSLGLYPPGAPAEDFSFSDTYDPVTFTGTRVAEARVWELFRQVSPDPTFAAAYLPYILGTNLSHRMPLYITPRRPLTLNHTFWLMRSHYAGSPLEFTDEADIGAGPFAAKFRVRPLFWKGSNGRSYHNERPIGTQQTGWHFTAVSRPGPVGSVVWFSVDDTSQSAHFPAYAKSTRVSKAWADEGVQHVDDTQQSTRVSFDSAFWVFNMVANLVYGRYEDAAPIVAAEIVRQEAKLFPELRAVDEAATLLFATGQDAAAIELMTKFSESAGTALVADWLQLWKDLFFRFRDQMTVTAPQRTAQPKDHPWPQANEQGYPQAWYDHIIAATGDRYAVPAATQLPSHLQAHEAHKRRVVGL